MNYVPLYTPPPPTVPQTLIRMSYGHMQPIANPPMSSLFSYTPEDPPLATIKRRVSAITAAGILKDLYPRRAPTRRLRWICAHVYFQARVERFADRTPATKP
jgi:hypothetical protein